MPEAVIVATARSPIGRANKGSLVDLRPDDLAAQIVTALLAKVPQLDPATVEDILLGCGQPAGEAGFNIARVVAILAGLDDVPGVTVNRYCSSSLQTIRMAAHAIKVGEGDVFVAGGVETVSRFGAGFSDSAPNPVFQPAGLRTLERAGGGQPPWSPPEGLPDIYIAMGQTAENVREYEGVSRAEMDEFAKLSQDRAVSNVENGFFADEITPVTLPDGSVVGQGRRSTCRCHAGGAGRPQAGVPPGRRGDRRQRLPAQRRGRGRVGDERHEGRRAGHHAARPDRVVGRLGLNPEIMGLGPIEASRQALARAGKTIDDIDLVEINEAFAAQVLPSAKHLGVDMGQAQRPRRGDRPWPPVRDDRRAHHDDADPRPPGDRWHVRPGDDVRRWRPGHGHGHRTRRLNGPLAPADSCRR